MIRILVADDHEILRWGLVQSLSGERDMVVVGEVDEAGAAVAEFQRLAPDVLIVDLFMPGGGGWVALERVLGSQPEARVIVLSAADDPRTVQTSLARGARAHLSKSEGVAELLDVVRLVAGGIPHGAAASASSPGSAGRPQTAGGTGRGDAGPG